MRIVQLTTDSRDHFCQYQNPQPAFGAAPQALLHGFVNLPELEVHVVSCVRRPLGSPAKIAPNIWYHSLLVPRWGWWRTAYQGCIRAVRKKLRVIQPDIVHGQGTERDCALAAVLSPFPNILTIHGNMAELGRRFGARLGSFEWLAAHLENFALKRTAGVFCNSEYTEALVRPRARRTWRVANPLRPEFFSALGRTEKHRRCTLLNVGVVTPRKRQVELLEVAENLRRQGLDFEWLFIGDASPADPYAARFLDRIKPLAAAGFARYLGSKSVSELIQCFDQAHALVHLPSEEAFGLVAAEAMARDLKFFGARTGGLVDIASGAPGAELFPPDDLPALAASLAAWIRAGFAPQPGAAALMRSRYHPEVIARRHLEIYREVLSSDS
jgi:glycosyltransferase involved in cell wall biosynthesis